MNTLTRAQPVRCGLGEVGFVEAAKLEAAIRMNLTKLNLMHESKP